MVPQLYQPTLVCKTRLHTKKLMEKPMHLCFAPWCTDGVRATKVSQDSRHKFLTSRQTVRCLRHTGCRTRLAGYWSLDTTFACWQDAHETAWDRLSDFETDCLTWRQTVPKESRQQNNRLKTQVSHVGCACDRQSDFKRLCAGQGSH